MRKYLRYFPPPHKVPSDPSDPSSVIVSPPRSSSRMEATPWWETALYLFWRYSVPFSPQDTNAGLCRGEAEWVPSAGGRVRRVLSGRPAFVGRGHQLRVGARRHLPERGTPAPASLPAPSHVPLCPSAPLQASVRSMFRRFAQRVRPNGTLLLCADEYASPLLPTPHLLACKRRLSGEWGAAVPAPSPCLPLSRRPLTTARW